MSRSSIAQIKMTGSSSSARSATLVQRDLLKKFHMPPTKWKLFFAQFYHSCCIFHCLSPSTVCSVLLLGWTVSLLLGTFSCVTLSRAVWFPVISHVGYDTLGVNATICSLDSRTMRWLRMCLLVTSLVITPIVSASPAPGHAASAPRHGVYLPLIKKHPLPPADLVHLFTYTAGEVGGWFAGGPPPNLFHLLQEFKSQHGTMKGLCVLPLGYWKQLHPHCPLGGVGQAPSMICWFIPFFTSKKTRNQLFVRRGKIAAVISSVSR